MMTPNHRLLDSAHPARVTLGDASAPGEIPSSHRL